MYEVVQRIDYKGHQIQERRLPSASGGTTPTVDGGRQIIPAATHDYTQWVIVKVRAGGQEDEVATAWSEDDAWRQIDELTKQ